MSVREWHGDMQGNEAWAREAAQRCIRAGFGVLRVATQNWADVKREHPEWFQLLFREKQCRLINVSHGFTEVYLQVCTVSPSCHFHVFSAYCGGIYPGIQNAVLPSPSCCFSHTATVTATATATATASATVTGYRLPATLEPAIGDPRNLRDAAEQSK